MAEDILLVERKDPICTLIFNRPERRNALSPELLIEMVQRLQELAEEGTIRAVVIRGSGDRAFSSGYDIRAIPTDVSPEIRERLRTQSPLELGMEALMNYPYPVIAMLNGYAFGAGCELSISCDIRIGAHDIRMGMPPAKLGIVYMPAGLQRFINILGLSATKEIFFTGRYYEAARCKELGLVDYLVPRDELEPFTYRLAEEIAGNAPLSLKGTKRILNLLAQRVRLEAGELREAQQLVEASFQSEDLKEGQRAFLEKRKPVFRGK